MLTSSTHRFQHIDSKILFSTHFFSEGYMFFKIKGLLCCNLSYRKVLIYKQCFSLPLSAQQFGLDICNVIVFFCMSRLY